MVILTVMCRMNDSRANVNRTKVVVPKFDTIFCITDEQLLILPFFPRDGPPANLFGAPI